MTRPNNAQGPVMDIANGIAVIRLNEPTTRNSLSRRAVVELISSLAEISSRPDINAIIFTGTDDVFTSGADIRELFKLDPQTARDFALGGQQLMQKIAEARQLTIAAINGYCMGGGLDLALTCDIRVASRNATFAHAGAGIGIITGWGGTQRLPKLIGRSRALEMFLTARVLGPSEAYAIGLVNFVVDSPVEFAEQIALRENEALS